MQPINIPNYGSYIDSMVAFVDVLGFDKEARGVSSDHDFYSIAKLLFAFKETAHHLNQDTALFKNLRMTTVSDSIVVSMPYKDPICTFSLVVLLHKTQYELLATEHRRLLRGYIARGHVYHDDGVVFGEGYSKAYEGEMNIGHAPRIVIDPDVIEDANAKIASYSGPDEPDHIFNYLKQDQADGLYFIDYLKVAGSQLLMSEEERKKERCDIEAFIQSQLLKFRKELKVQRKYRWLESYYQQAHHAG